MSIETKEHGKLLNLKFKNKKNGCIYIAERIIKNATNSADWQTMVLYYREGSPNEKYVREIEEFNVKFEKYEEVFQCLK